MDFRLVLLQIFFFWNPHLWHDGIWRRESLEGDSIMRMESSARSRHSKKTAVCTPGESPHQNSTRLLPWSGLIVLRRVGGADECKACILSLEGDMKTLSLCYHIARSPSARTSQGEYNNRETGLITGGFWNRWVSWLLAEENGDATDLCGLRWD